MFQALAGAYSNAEEARKNAQEAQVKYAEQASEDADIIRHKANDTKTAARKLRGEADALNNRVVVTENRIENFEELAKKDDSLTEEAKEKVCCVDVIQEIVFLIVVSYTGWTSKIRFI